MLPSNWLSSGPYGTMYSISVHYNACSFYSLFVWYRQSLNQRYTSGRKPKEDKKPLHWILIVLLFTLTEFDNDIPWETLL